MVDQPAESSGFDEQRLGADMPPAGRPDEKLAAALALDWIDHDLMPRVIVGDDLVILWSNIAARALLAARRDVESRSGILSTVDRSKQQGLAHFVTTSEVAISTWALKRADGDGHVLFRAQRIDWQGGGLFGVALYGSGSEFHVRYADVDLVFGLTPAEHRILLDLLEGCEADRLAEIHAVSIETVRTHIRNIYAKLHVRSRESLFHRLQPYRI
ncbi:MAG TPA: helix-turn-helix transcriptional regulator [Allosphingosinicella sp.]|nr:helix-turn-helix transcriptional regulator [Allosphingosinicella sp.]